jgi:site-specific DNA recombinase
MKPPSKPVGIWIRVSTEDQAHGESPEHHEKRGRYYAESKDWKVKEVYHLEAVSGKSVKEHPETKRMLSAVTLKPYLTQNPAVRLLDLSSVT